MNIFEGDLKLILLLIGFIIILLFSIYRFYKITYRIIKKELTLKEKYDGLLGLLGVIGWFLLFSIIVISIWIIILTFFFMEAGRGSGILLVITMIYFPFLYLISEVIIKISFKKSRRLL